MINASKIFRSAIGVKGRWPIAFGAPTPPDPTPVGFITYGLGSGVVTVPKVEFVGDIGILEMDLNTPQFRRGSVVLNDLVLRGVHLELNAGNVVLDELAIEGEVL